MKKYSFLLCLLFLLNSCKQETPQPVAPSFNRDAYQVAFLIMDGTFNTEFTAPYDIFQHTRFREGIKHMEVFTVANTLDPITTFEGVRILPDYDYTKGNLPPIDILVVPSAEHHLDTDLQDTTMINWVKKTAQNAEWVTSHCDGAFVLATAGLLDGTISTTFPDDINTYKDHFPHLKVADSVCAFSKPQASCCTAR